MPNMPNILPGPTYSPAFEVWWKTQAPDYANLTGIMANTFKEVAFRGWSAYYATRPTNPIDQDTARQAVYALLDILDGEQDHDLEYKTGLPPTRCAEITNLRSHLYTEYGAEWLKTFA